MHLFFVFFILIVVLEMVSLNAMTIDHCDHQGYVQMAIGGVYAGRMFDTLCGLGLGLTVATLKGESVQLFWGCCCCWTLNVLFFFSLVFLLVFFLDGAQRA